MHWYLNRRSRKGDCGQEKSADGFIITEIRPAKAQEGDGDDAGVKVDGCYLARREPAWEAARIVKSDGPNTGVCIGRDEKHSVGREGKEVF